MLWLPHPPSSPLHLYTRDERHTSALQKLFARPLCVLTEQQLLLSFQVAGSVSQGQHKLSLKTRHRVISCQNHPIAQPP